MSGLLEYLRRQRVLVADGAMGTMLMAKGLKAGECPERMNLERPELLEEIAKSYIGAGADIIQTNTFGGSPLKLALYRLENRTEEINAVAVRAARRGAGPRARVSASVGPCGRLLKPHGDITSSEVLEGFKLQIRALIAEGVDMISIETMTDLTEAILAVTAAKSISSSTPVCATMTFDRTPRGFFTIMGVSVEQAVLGLSDAGADIIGSNCGNGIQNMIEIAAEFEKCSRLPIVIRSNAGLPRMNGDITVYPETPEFFADNCQRLLEIGVSVIGGCCGTTPDHIAAIRETVDRFLAKGSIAGGD